MGRWWAIDPALQCASPYMAMGNNPMMMIDADGRTWGVFKAMGQAWDYAWDKGNQFARWADENGIPSFNVGIGMNSGGQVNPIVNGQNINENNSINQGVANAGNSLTSQLANLPIDNSSYRPLNRARLPNVWSDPLINNGFLNGNDNFMNYTLELNILGLKNPGFAYNGTIHSLNSYDANSWEKLRDNYGIAGSVSYQLLDEASIVGQRIGLQKIPSTITHLDNSVVNRSEIVDAGVNTMVNWIPVTNIGSQLKIAKSTFSVSYFNKFYKGTGIYSSKNGGMYLRQFNNVIKNNIGSKKWYNYASYGGFSPYFFNEKEE